MIIVRKWGPCSTHFKIQDFLYTLSVTTQMITSYLSNTKYHFKATLQPVHNNLSGTSETKRLDTGCPSAYVQRRKAM
jgi:hypothetical protein